MDDINIDPSQYELALQIGSKEHFKESSNTGETWHIPADDYFYRLQMTQSKLGHIANVFNSGEFISSDRGFSASMTLIHRDVKGGKRSGYKPGKRIWQEVVKEMRCVHEVKNNDELCCGRAIVVMREYAKNKADEPNCYENVRKNDIVIPRKEVMESVCEIYKKCKTCLVSYKEGVQHKCGHGQCINCLNYVDLYSHQCFIVSDIYRENKRREIKHKSEERRLEAIKQMSTIDGKKSI